MQKRPRNPGSFREGHTKLPAIQAAPLPEPIEAAKLLGYVEADAKGYRLGQCTIMVGTSDTGWHMSIAHPLRYPTWDEIAKARYELIPDDVEMAMLLPRPEDYVNVHTFCFQLHQVRIEEHRVVEITRS